MLSHCRSVEFTGVCTGSSHCLKIIVSHHWRCLQVANILFIYLLCQMTARHTFIQTVIHSYTEIKNIRNTEITWCKSQVHRHGRWNPNQSYLTVWRQHIIQITDSNKSLMHATTFVCISQKLTAQQLNVFNLFTYLEVENNLTKHNRTVLPVLTSQARMRPLLCPVIITTSCVTMRRYRTDVDGCCFSTGLVMRQNAIEFTNDPTLIVSLSSFSTPSPRRTELRNTTLHT